MANSLGPNKSIGGVTEILDFSNWVFGAVGRSVAIVRSSGAGTDTATYKNADASTAFVIVTTYSDNTFVLVTNIARSA